ncbi:MAG: 50S ribosomal protein L9 [Deltaproteobacteria bacterium]|nr:50S ribosomal protein L9 [Deltaproteobacteria bacterium]MCF8119635.1 50S ribosomal protein L9 [Deltaproteobacteria bacterium]
MEVILTQDFDELGLEGDVVNVAKGYGRNYLIPQGIAIEATPQNRKAMELKSKKIEVRRLKVKADAETLKERMESLVVSLSQKAGEEGKLYGSVTSMDIASALENQGISIDKRKIVLEKPIKTLGEFDIPVKIYPEVTANLRVTVNPEEA